MAKKDEKEVNEKEYSYQGCYGEKVAPSQLVQFLDDMFLINTEAEASKSDERFATCIWGHAGCVLADTVVEVRKIKDGGHHKIVTVNPNP
jgi:hypothetical protein